MKLLSATVGHARHTPRKNVFEYRVYYVVRDMQEAAPTPALCSQEHWNVFSLYNRDHGARDGSPLIPWLQNTLASHGIKLLATDRITLIAHPRLFGYAFNPISYWLIRRNDELIAVACEVHNTFGDDHTYVLAHDDLRPIRPDDTLHAEKHLYVSPFNTMRGRYEFRFELDTERFKSVINYFEGNERIVSTFMGGTMRPLTDAAILGAVVRYPLMTLLVIGRIHWQALRLRIKGVLPTLAQKPVSTSQGSTRGR